MSEGTCPSDLELSSVPLSPRKEGWRAVWLWGAGPSAHALANKPLSWAWWQATELGLQGWPRVCSLEAPPKGQESF